METTLAVSARPLCAQCGRPAFGYFRGEPRCFPHQNHKQLPHAIAARLRQAAWELVQNDDVGLPHDLDPVSREHAWGVRQRSADPYARLAKGE